MIKGLLKAFKGPLTSNSSSKASTRAGSEGLTRASFWHDPSLLTHLAKRGLAWTPFKKSIQVQDQTLEVARSKFSYNSNWNVTQRLLSSLLLSSLHFSDAQV